MKTMVMMFGFLFVLVGGIVAAQGPSMATTDPIGLLEQELEQDRRTYQEVLRWQRTLLAVETMARKRIVSGKGRTADVEGLLERAMRRTKSLLAQGKARGWTLAVPEGFYSVEELREETKTGPKGRWRDLLKRNEKFRGALQALLKLLHPPPKE